VGYFIWFLTSEKPPSFIAKNPITNLDAQLVLEAKNRPAKKSNDLLIFFDNIVHENIAIPSPNLPYSWAIDLNQIDARLRTDGKHLIKAGFEPGNLSDEIAIIIDTKIPSIGTTIKGDSLRKHSGVKGISSNNLYLDTLTAEVYFFHKGQTQKINVPVTKIVQQSTGDLTFEFETTLQGFPKYLPDDPEYAEPFFGFKITDIAGNSYFSVQSYAEFMAPGEKIFGISNVGEITYNHDVDDFNFLTSNFSIKANKEVFRKLPSGEPAIILTVNNKLGNSERELIWKSRLSKKQPLTLVYRDDKHIGSTFDNKYIDEIPEELIVDYRVEQLDTDNNLYTSNVVNNISQKRVQFDSLNQELIKLEDMISEQQRYKDSLANAFRDFNKLVRIATSFPKNSKGYTQKDLSAFVDLHLPDTLYQNRTNSVILNFFDEKINEKATPIQVSLSSGNTILQYQSYELKQHNKLRVVPSVASGKRYKFTIGIYFKDQLEGDYPPFYRITRNVIVN